MSVIQLLLKLRCVVGRTFARLSVRDFEIHWISRGFRVSEWISKWICGFKGGYLDFKLKTEMETQPLSCYSQSNVGFRS